MTNALLTRLKAGDEAIVPAHWPFEDVLADRGLTLEDVKNYKESE